MWLNPTSLRTAETAIFQLICNRLEISPRVGHARHVDSRRDGAYNTQASSCCIGGSTMRRNYTAIHVVCAALPFALSALGATAALAQAIDPGVRQAATDNGPPPALAGASADELNFFQDGLARFSSVKVVLSPTGDNSGLGPRFNSNQCSSCHLQPFVGGSSPAINPLPAVAGAGGATNTVPWFIVPNGPIREARFVSDGGVHDLFVVTGRSDAPGCNIAQPVFTPAGNGLSGRGGNPNVVFRIPTSLLGAGLIEAIPDSTILDNARDNAFIKRLYGVSGHTNRSGNDGTITRFGWKAQNKSLLLFSGEAYNVEQGVTNDLFPNKRAASPGCNLNPLPEDSTNIHNPDAPNSLAGSANQMSSDMVNFAVFMRLLAPPTATTSTPSELNGAQVFASVGCNLCHTQTLVAEQSIFTGQSGVHFRPYTDVALHHMGPRLADQVSQGAAGPDEFRTAPLWGVGQRIFFLHDGRAGPKNGGLLAAILAHASSNSDCDERQLLTG